jgi:hypothetical protein
VLAFVYHEPRADPGSTMDQIEPFVGLALPILQIANGRSASICKPRRHWSRHLIESLSFQPVCDWQHSRQCLLIGYKCTLRRCLYTSEATMLKLLRELFSGLGRFRQPHIQVTHGLYSGLTLPRVRDPS